MKLSEHFYLSEFIDSQEAARKGLNNTPSDEVLENLKKLASFMEKVRWILGKPITITSGYRSPLVNAAIGGAINSSHIKGLAADFVCPQFGRPLDICRKLDFRVSGITYDQLIHEYGRWVHIGIEEPVRNQNLTAKRANEKTEWINKFVEAA